MRANRCNKYGRFSKTITKNVDRDQDWDVIITLRKKWWDLQLRDVWHYRDLISLFVRLSPANFGLPLRTSILLNLP